MPSGYNNNLEILQGPATSRSREMIRDTRIIGWTARTFVRHSDVARRLARPLEGNTLIHNNCTSTTGFPSTGSCLPQPAPNRTLHAYRSGDRQLPVYDGRSADLGKALVRRDRDGPGARTDLRIRLP